MIKRLKQWTSKLKKELVALYLAYKNPKISIIKRIFILFVVAYAFSPIDLIPEFIPILGYLDDLILVPLGIYIALKLIPKEIMEECREKAEDLIIDKPKLSWVIGGMFILIWIGILTAIILKLVL